MIATCPTCGKKLDCDASLVGKPARCPGCNNVFTVTADAPAPSMFGAAPVVEPPMPRSNGSTGSQIMAALNCSFLPAGVVKIARLVMVAGLLIVLGARGCSSISSQGVVRAGAKIDAARAEFDDKWNQKIADAKPEDKFKLQDDKMKEQEKLEKNEWKDLRADARDARTGFATGGYWREIAFVTGTLAFAAGLLLVGVGGVGFERIACLVLLVIIVFSVYIGGLAWLQSLLTMGMSKALG